MIRQKRAMSFVTKLNLLYLVMLLVPLIIITIFSYQKSNTEIRKQSIYSNEQSLNQAASFLEYKLSSLNTILDIISYDQTIQTLLKTGSPYARGMEGNWFVQTTDVQNFIYNPYITNEMQSVRIYPNTGSSSIEESDEFRSMPEDVRLDWSQRFEDALLFQPLLLPPTTVGTKEEISLVKRIPDFNSINKYIGVIKGDIPQDVFQAIVNQTSTVMGTSVFLFNSHNEVIAQVLDTSEIHVSNIQDLIQSNEMLLDGKLRQCKLNGIAYLGGGKNIEHSDWTLFMMIPTKKVFAASDIYGMQLAWYLVVLIVLSVIITTYTTKALTVRINKLKEHIEESTQKGFDIPPLENGNDEIGQLTGYYDKMATRIKALMNAQFQYGYQIKNLEFKVLQSTIDPHFLYNSLDMIYWSAIQNNDVEVSNMAKALSKFYKLSLAHGKTMVTLRDEIEHVKVYVSIQNMRFDGKVDLLISVPDELMECTVFKIMLQPIVENSILHGIREKESESGTIRIKARLKNDNLIISVADDGVGMDEESIQNLLKPKEETKGYGIWNINERIRITHGDNYGLKFFSKPTVGTCVFITLPISKNQWTFPKG